MGFVRLVLRDPLRRVSLDPKLVNKLRPLDIRSQPLKDGALRVVNDVNHVLVELVEIRRAIQ